MLTREEMQIVTSTLIAKVRLNGWESLSSTERSVALMLDFLMGTGIRDVARKNTPVC